jgi:hypothetical protein
VGPGSPPHGLNVGACRCRLGSRRRARNPSVGDRALWQFQVHLSNSWNLVHMRLTKERDAKRVARRMCALCTRRVAGTSGERTHDELPRHSP